MLAQRISLSEDETLAARPLHFPDAKRVALLEVVRKVIATEDFVKDEDIEAVRLVGCSDGQTGKCIGYIGLAASSNLFAHVHNTRLDFPPAKELEGGIR